MKKVSIILCLLIWSITACQNNTTTPSPNGIAVGDSSTNVNSTDSEPALAVGGSVQFKEIKLQKQEGDCKENVETVSPCVQLNISYPSPINGVPALQQNIEKAITDLILPDLMQKKEGQSITLEQGAEEFVRLYKEEMKQNPDHIMPWEYEIHARNTHQSDQIITIQLDNYSFLGGAHPNSYVTYLNFDPKTGKQYSANELVTDVNTLLPIAEKYFRQATEMDAKEKMADRGFEFPDEKFALPKNIGYDEQNLVLYYNPYEIAAYAQGPTEVKIPLTEVAQLLRYQ
ncbi:MAG: DUF3298 and DUF4163 domain-containing protein [Chitinophagales bacterium]|jgi:hypothetical protein|nr:DUF3298 and DUF4163 domain-containing protein [Chitinophagales bacterium]